jgi:hypothetical protein
VLSCHFIAASSPLHRRFIAASSLLSGAGMSRRRGGAHLRERKKWSQHSCRARKKKFATAVCLTPPSLIHSPYLIQTYGTTQIP